MHPLHPLAAALQVTQVAQSASGVDGLASHLVQFAVAIILAINTWMVRSVQQTREMVRKIDQALFGVTGNNGINSLVNSHDTLIAEHEAYIRNTVPERLKLWDAFKLETERRLGVLDRRRGPSDRRDHDESHGSGR